MSGVLAFVMIARAVILMMDGFAPWLVILVACGVGVGVLIAIIKASEVVVHKW